ncbi:MAG: TRAP transporter large permease subunit [Ardenticatenaceae bacterium]|nr:TRAP transporter large permease subunit [Anaerolineales bacterium]MCB8920566.1 TRAP transporter large permease subunit [Ardenticatenaceae bacterium]MCB8990189.1 TRAP transporter large permease subunit [Ardenticatenaceae bacterium]MCB9003020.1 TRAP transporter large permease subunit [Ardenticatenaceae bacterium]
MGFEWLAIVMFVLFLFLILSGYPVAFSFAGTSIVFGLIGLALGAFDLNLLKLLPNRWFGAMSDFTLLAIPFFVFMGAMFEKSGLAEELLTTIGIALGPIRGGLALAAIFVGTLLAAATGVVAATVIVMGLLSLPIMVRYNYDHKLATGVITASGTLAQLLPPSLVLVVLSSQVGVSVGDLFLGALIPGIMLALLYALYVVVIAIVRPEAAPALPPEARIYSGWALVRRSMLVVVPPLLLIFAVLGSIFAGLATPTEAGAVGAFGACVLAALNRNLTWKIVKEAGRSTANITALVLMILFCSTFFGLVFDGLGGQLWVTNFLTGLPGGFWGFIIVANIAVFLLGINLEFLEISFIVMPLFVPAATALAPMQTHVAPDLMLVWFSVMMAVNLNMAFISPPVGFSLFYLQSVAPPEVETLDIHKGALPFMGLQVVGLILVMLFPSTVEWLVRLAG